MNLVRGLVKAIALVGGAFVTVVSLMAIVGMQTGNGWARGAIALVVAVGLPLLLVEGVLARVSPDKARGVATDVLAVTYLGFALAFVGVAHAYARPVLEVEAQRLEQAGMAKLATATYWLAGGRGAPTPATLVAAPATPVAAPIAPTAPVKPAEVKPPELRAGDGKERTPAQIFTEFAPSVVTVMTKSPMGEGSGTAFVIDKAGTIATNYHVIDRAGEIKVKLMDGTFATSVEVLAESEPLDLALLHITTDHALSPVVLGDSDKVTVGERAVSIGNPLGLEHTLTDGLISARRVIEGRKMIQMSTPVSPGNSGGPLFNSRGEVIGVSSAVYLGGSPLAQNLNLAVPIDDVRSLVRPDYPQRHKVGERPAGNAGRW